MFCAVCFQIKSKKKEKRGCADQAVGCSYNYQQQGAIKFTITNMLELCVTSSDYQNFFFSKKPGWKGKLMFVLQKVFIYIKYSKQNWYPATVTGFDPLTRSGQTQSGWSRLNSLQFIFLCLSAAQRLQNKDFHSYKRLLLTGSICAQNVSHIHRKITKTFHKLLQLFKVVLLSI